MFNELLSLKSSKVKIIGIGGGGNNIVNHLADYRLKQVSLTACDTDAATLAHSRASTTLQLGNDGLGSGNLPHEAQAIAEQEIIHIRKLFSKNTDILFIVSCLGGGCGSGVAPIVARASKEMNITTIGIVTTPFHFEGQRKESQASKAIKDLSIHTDAMFIFNNQYIMQNSIDEPLTSAFTDIDEMMNGVIKYLTQFMTSIEKNHNTTKQSLLTKIKNIFKP